MESKRKFVWKYPKPWNGIWMISYNDLSKFCELLRYTKSIDVAYCLYGNAIGNVYVLNHFSSILDINLYKLLLISIKWIRNKNLSLYMKTCFIDIWITTFVMLVEFTMLQIVQIWFFSLSLIDFRSLITNRCVVSYQRPFKQRRKHGIRWT